MTRIRIYSRASAENPSPLVEAEHIDSEDKRAPFGAATTVEEVACFFGWTANSFPPSARFRYADGVAGWLKLKDLHFPYRTAIDSLGVLSCRNAMSAASAPFLEIQNYVFNHQGFELQTHTEDIRALTESIMLQVQENMKASGSSTDAKPTGIEREKIALPKHDRATRLAAAKRMAELWKESGNEPTDGVEYQNRMRAEWQ